jgi:hypothetical protein
MDEEATKKTATNFGKLAAVVLHQLQAEVPYLISGTRYARS